MEVIGYCRVSTEEQADGGVSMAAQAERIRAWAELNEHDVVEIYEDAGLSGKDTKRPGLQAALDAALERGAVLVVYSLSRLSRSVRDMLALSDQLEKGGAEFVSVTEKFDTTTAMGRAFYKIIGVLAELEREQIVERTKVALSHKRQRGELTGTPPFGWRAATKGPLDENGVAEAVVLEYDEREQQALAKMLDLAAAGTMSYAAIGRELDRLHLPPRTGATWERGSLRRIVKFYGSARGRQLLDRLATPEG